MLKIRLQRVGRKNDPLFRIVLTDSKNSTKSGRYLEVLGNFDFRKDIDKKIHSERVTHWLAMGAKATPTVHNLLLKEGIIKGKKINVLPRKSPPKKEEAPVAEASAAPAAASEVVAEAAPVEEEKVA